MPFEQFMTAQQCRGPSTWRIRIAPDSRSALTAANQAAILRQGRSHFESDASTAARCRSDRDAYDFFAKANWV